MWPNIRCEDIRFRELRLNSSSRKYPSACIQSRFKRLNVLWT